MGSWPQHNGRLHQIGVGRTHARTPILMLINGLDISIIHTTTGEIIRELILNPAVDYQTQVIARPDQSRSGFEVSPISCDMTRVELMHLNSNLALSALYSFG